MARTLAACCVLLLVQGEYADNSGAQEYAAPVAASYVQPTAFNQNAKCNCKPQSPCFNPSTGTCSQSFGDITPQPYDGSQLPQQYASQEVQQAGYYGQLRRLVEYDQKFSQDDGFLQRHFQCSNTMCPSGSFMCTSCWKTGHTTEMVNWAMFGIMLFATILFAFQGLRHDDSFAEVSRVIPFMSSSITLMTSIAYLIMATAHGFIQSCPDTKPSYYIRYLDWIITMPIMLLLLSFIKALPIESRCFVVFLDIIMVFSWAMGAAVTIGTKWIFFAFGLLCLLPILFTFHWEWRRRQTASTDFNKKVDTALWILTVTWLMYPVMWVITEGTGSICSDTETVLYAVLDVLAKLGVLSVLNTINARTTLFDPLSGGPGLELMPGGSFI